MIIRMLHKFLVPRFMAAEVARLREFGLGGYIRKRGPWFFAGIFVFYLVRDVTLYMIIPYLVVNGMVTCQGPEPT